jgi:hypothetical protein
MNERIQLLALQADPGYTGNDLDGLGASLVGNDAIEKFAQLIVRECMGIAKHNIYDPEYRGGSQILESFENYQANRRAEDILLQIQQHFGVKS